MKNHLEIQFLRVDELKPPRRSLRNHNRKNLNMLRASMEQSGMVIPIIVDENNYIIDGHARWVVAKVLGIKVVPTICLANRTGVRTRAARNRTLSLNGAGTLD
ncbi:ParB N-terminal domain-containing protein [Mesorhizobium australicum]|uniref:ParB N-terminal domain-containing protein n=1 Tax=Mesorhizobium australicum TaxID=536018 RepID=UPI000A1CDB1D|nr:ParB N-terminal domain-containing protein [Mesorhizobium australicum]